MSKKNLFAIFILVCFGIFFSSLRFSDTAPETQTPTTPNALAYEAYSLGINTVLYDISGQINYRLRAERQTQFTDETTLLEKPTIRLYQQGMPSWNVVADTGTIPQPETSETGDTRLILLNGNVRVHSENRFGNQTTMTTDSLDVNIDKEQLSTLALVFVETEVISQTSTGMFADLGKDEIIFHQNTQGTYAHDKSN